MRVLFLSQYFPPEMGAPAKRTFELSRHWARRGLDVTVLTAFPHHPTGVIPQAYRGRRFQRERIGGVDVFRTWVYATPNEGFWKRSLSYGSFMLSATVVGIFVGKRPSVVVATSPQFLAAVAGWAVSRVRRRPFVFEVRDLWPDSIIAVGAMEEGLIFRFLKRLELFLYRQADLIVGVADSTRRYLSGLGIADEKIQIVPNGIEPDHYEATDERLHRRKALGLDGKFIAAYIGTHGMAHGLHHVLEAAHLIREARDIHFLFVGEGAEKESLLRRCHQLGLTNVTFLGQQPQDAVPGLLLAADAVLVSLREHPLFEKVLPSKLFEAMAARRPVVMSIRGEAKDLLELAGGGVTIEPEDARAMGEAILHLSRDPDLCRRLGESGGRFVREHYSRAKLAQRYANLLEELAVDG